MHVDLAVDRFQAGRPELMSQSGRSAAVGKASRAVEDLRIDAPEFVTFACGKSCDGGEGPGQRRDRFRSLALSKVASITLCIRRQAF
jgi:hypothetical protein